MENGCDKIQISKNEVIEKSLRCLAKKLIQNFRTQSCLSQPKAFLWKPNFLVITLAWSRRFYIIVSKIYTIISKQNNSDTYTL